MFIVLPLVYSELYYQMIPYVGKLPAIKYLWVLIGVIVSIWYFPDQSLKHNVNIVTFLLLILTVILGISGLWVQEYTETANTSFRYSPLRPFFHTLIPIIWAIILGWKIAWSKLPESKTF